VDSEQLVTKKVKGKMYHGLFNRLLGENEGEASIIEFEVPWDGDYRKHPNGKVVKTFPKVTKDEGRREIEKWLKQIE